MRDSRILRLGSSATAAAFAGLAEVAGGGAGMDDLAAALGDFAVALGDFAVALGDFELDAAPAVGDLGFDFGLRSDGVTWRPRHR
jgi:hypothetical protein